ncbi:c-type cytochrome [Pelistega indica]|uniref:c-type cytochrome n=1 Tax=Pelistega indica TaxID=1414851 RepID=UPI0004CF6901|nr:c-type cytochrome [Pelistega indica]
MKRLSILLFPLLTMSAVYAQPSLDASTLLKNKICMHCHQVNERRVGPSFKMVADKYQQDKTVTVEELAKRIVEGGIGQWGPLRMPAQPKVSTEEAIIMADWILHVKGDEQVN